jgi:HK97 family phage portal protein
MARWWTRAIRPTDNPPPNPDPGDPHGVIVAPDPPSGPPLPRVIPSTWPGWPQDWWTPQWDPKRQSLTDTAWMCVDLNASILATMPPYLVSAADTLDDLWLQNPNPNVYSSWAEFAKQLFWDFQLGEVFVLATARYSTGWPARFHVVPPWYVDVEMDGGSRSYTIGKVDVTADMLHIRYASTVDDAHGHGPLEAGGARLTAADTLMRYGYGLASSGGVPSSVLEHPDELSADQAAELRAQWVVARQSALGEPAVLSGGVTWKPTQINPKDMALLELQTFNESRIAILLGVPPFLVGLPSSGDSLTYSNVQSIFDFHWRAGLRPKAEAVTSALSEWLLPRGTTLEVNKDAYIQPGPLDRSKFYETMNKIRDEQGNPAMTVNEIRQAERIERGIAPEGVLQ